MGFSRLNFPKSFHLYLGTVYYGEGLDKRRGVPQPSKQTAWLSYHHTPGAAQPQLWGPAPPHTAWGPALGSLSLEVETVL